MPDADSWRQVLTLRSVPHSDAEICVNCWYFVDCTGVVLRLAAKAYALSGTDDEKLTLLKRLSATDHLTAIQGRVPQRYVVSMDGQEFHGAVPASAIEADPVPVFEEMFDQILRTLPELFQAVDDSYQPFKMELREPFLWVSTAVYEESDGTLVARVS